MRTPVCDFVREFAEQDGLRLHMPGHKGQGPLGVESLDITDSFVSLIINFALFVNAYFQPFRKRINYRCTYTMKSTGYFISSTAKFTAGMKNGKYYLYRRDTGLLIDSNRNSTTII